MDIFSDDFYEQLLRFCATGKSAYIGCSPCCGEYSRALRLPGQLDGRAGLSTDEAQRLQDSFLQLSRGVQCLRVAYAAGSHGHFEQPTNAMSWEEEVVQCWLSESHALCINIPACAYGWDIYKSWLFATSLDSLTVLAHVCDHPINSHQSIEGIKDSSSSYLSKATAQYPADFATAFADQVIPLISMRSSAISLEAAMAFSPVKSLQDPPQAFQDGGGVFSRPDWSYPPSECDNLFASLRTEMFDLILQFGYHTRTLCHLHKHDPSAPFTDSELLPFRLIMERWFQNHGHSVSWDVRAHQPMCLMALQTLSAIMQDADSHLFQSLIDGVPTGYNGDIPGSNCFSIKPSDENAGNQPLSIHLDNWRSASDRPEVTDKLVQAELDQGWVEKFDGDLLSAQARWPHGLAIGRLGVALSDHRDPRLVVDSSVCGTNSSCQILEHQNLPTAKDVLRTSPLRDNTAELGGLSLDIKAAHKRIVIRESERGLLGFSHNGSLFFLQGCSIWGHFFCPLVGATWRILDSLPSSCHLCETRIMVIR